MSTDLMDKSFEDERKNLAEHIWNIMVAKLETIQNTVPQTEIQCEILKIKNWWIAENFVSEFNSPVLNKSLKSVRMESWNPSEAAPYFGNNSFWGEEGEYESSESRPVFFNPSLQEI